MPVTKSNVITVFKRFTSLYDLKTSAEIIKSLQDGNYYTNDFIKLDFNSVYGGYRLDIVHKNTSESFFDGQSRKNAKEMIAYMQGLIAARQIDFSSLITGKKYLLIKA